MYKTDSCTVTNNDASHVNRFTDPSDCASILLYFSRLNNIQHNNFSFGGDGIFTNANIYGPNSIPNFHDDNYFAYNNCSYSPHNAIESVFTDGNVFVHNNCSNSYYGIWAGYAINTIIDSNLISNNAVDGIAIEHGLNNTIRNDSIFMNAQNGIHLWADSGSAPPLYVNRDSHGYLISNNYFTLKDISEIGHIPNFNPPLRLRPHDQAR
jgi:parallel beta-helix repeat protein